MKSMEHTSWLCVLWESRQGRGGRRKDFNSKWAETVREGARQGLSGKSLLHGGESRDPGPRVGLVLPCEGNPQGGQGPGVHRALGRAEGKDVWVVMDGLWMRSCISSGSLLALFLQGWGTREDLPPKLGTRAVFQGSCKDGVARQGLAGVSDGQGWICGVDVLEEEPAGVSSGWDVCVRGEDSRIIQVL